MIMLMQQSNGKLKSRKKEIPVLERERGADYVLILEAASRANTQDCESK